MPIALDVTWRFRLALFHIIPLKAPIATKVVCFSCLLKCLRSLYGKQCVPDQTAPGSPLFASIPNSSVMLGNDFSRRHFQMYFFLGALRVKCMYRARESLYPKSAVIAGWLPSTRAKLYCIGVLLKRNRFSCYFISENIIR